MKKTALVTGAAGGIGFATVKQLLEKGWYVFGMDVLPAERAAEKFDGLADCCYLQGNLSDSEDRERLIRTVVGQNGRLDALVNVAGVAPKVRRDLLEMTEESYDFVMGINTKGTLFLTQLAARQMIRQEKLDGARGYIVNISSCSAYTSSVSRGEYCISKAGVSMITMLFADRLAAEGIPVNEICPGVIRTGMTAAVQEKYDRLISEGLIPIARWGEPEDIAKAVEILCSGALGYTTGQSILVDGGMHIRKL
ncbi:MAG: 3-ketoacyl-ACP reductase [Firmicutes bacterium]|nr:3-ketoacyl-ACP reductase [Bacillota bacterium]